MIVAVTIIYDDDNDNGNDGVGIDGGDSKNCHCQMCVFKLKIKFTKSCCFSLKMSVKVFKK